MPFCHTPHPHFSHSLMSILTPFPHCLLSHLPSLLPPLSLTLPHTQLSLTFSLHRPIPSAPPSSLSSAPPPLPLSDTPEARENVYARFLKSQSCYDVIPSSTKIVVLDTRLRVKKAFFALVANGMGPGRLG